MKQTQTIRIVKHKQKKQTEIVAEVACARGAAEPSEREMRMVVSGWVHDHQRRVEDFRRNYAATLRDAGLLLPARV